MTIKTNRGFSLVEVMIATVIFVIAGLGVFSLIRMSSLAVVAGNQKVRADNFAQQILEQVKAEAATQFDTLNTLAFANQAYPEIETNPNFTSFVAGTTNYFPGMTADLSVSAVAQGKRDIAVTIHYRDIEGKNELSSKYFYQLVRGTILPQGATVDCFVFDNQDNVGIPAASVYAPLFGDPISTIPPELTDGTGHCILRNVAEGKIDVTAHKFGCVPNAAAFNVNADQGYYNEVDGNNTWFDGNDTYIKSVQVPNVRVNQANPANINLFPLGRIKLSTKDLNNVSIKGVPVKCETPWGTNLAPPLTPYPKNTDVNGEVWFFNVAPGPRHFWIETKDVGIKPFASAFGGAIEATFEAVNGGNGWSYLGADLGNTVIIGGKSAVLNIVPAEQLHRFGFVNFTVKKKQGGAAFNGAKVRVFDGAWYGVTAGAGNYYVYNLISSDGNRLFEAYRDDGDNYGWYGKDTFNAKIEKNNGDASNNVVIDVVQGTSLTGIVYDDGVNPPTPWPNVTVKGTGIDGWARTCVSLADGSYALTELQPSLNGGDKKNFTLSFNATVDLQVTVKGSDSGLLIDGANVYVEDVFQGNTVVGFLNINGYNCPFSKTCQVKIDPVDFVYDFYLKPATFLTNLKVTADKPADLYQIGTTHKIVRPGDVKAVTVTMPKLATCTAQGKVYHTAVNTIFAVAGIRVADVNNLGNFTTSVAGGAYTLNNVKIVGGNIALTTIVTPATAPYYDPPNVPAASAAAAGAIVPLDVIIIQKQSGF